jgi:elongation factor Ts
MASAKDIKALRERTGAGILDCKKALAECNDDMEAAIDWLRAKGISAAAKKSSRIAAEGLVHAYIHAGGKIGVLIEVNCETDFVAMTDGFKELVHNIAMQIAAHSPLYVSVEEIPAGDLAREREVQKARVLEEGKPEHIADKIVDGRINKWHKEVCLLDQDYFRDEDKTIRDLLTDAVGTIGENIKVRRFIRWNLGEGLEKRSDDFVAEVMSQMKKG